MFNNFSFKNDRNDRPSIKLAENYTTYEMSFRTYTTVNNFKVEEFVDNNSHESHESRHLIQICTVVNLMGDNDEADDSLSNQSCDESQKKVFNKEGRECEKVEIVRHSDTESICSAVNSSSVTKSSLTSINSNDEPVCGLSVNSCCV